jgi:hypothetical protein
MRPTVSEQLAGVRRILADVVAPEVHSAYPSDMLRGILANLEMLERSWGDVAPFLAWDNGATMQLLADVASHVEGDVAAKIGAVLAEPDADPLDVAALEARNTRLRGALADAVPVLAAAEDLGSTDVYTAVRSHLRERIERFPLTMNAPMPGAKR